MASGYLNSLAGTVTGANTVSINTGGALVDGKWFSNPAAASVNIPSAVGGGNTRIDRIVLRCSWAGYAVSITRIAGTDAASPTAPAIVQTTGTTYDIKLYQALVNTAGAVTLTDERTFGGAMTAGYAMLGAANTAPTPTAITGDVTVTSAGVTAISAGAIVAADLAADAVETAKIKDANVTTDKILNANVTKDKMAANSVDSDQYVDGSIDHEHLSTLAGKLIYRQGGSASDWDAAGTTDYAVSGNKIQIGNINIAAGATSVTVTFAQAFTNKPWGIAIISHNASNSAGVVTSKTGMTIYAENYPSATRTIVWMAIGD